MKNNILDLINDGYTPEAEILFFEMVGGTKIEEFIKTPKRKRKVEDYGKYLGISVVFHLKRIFLRLLGDGESRIDEILNYFVKAGKNYLVVEGWILEAIENIRDQKLKESGLELWKEAKKKCGEHNFDIKNLFS